MEITCLSVSNRNYVHADIKIPVFICYILYDD